MNIRNNEREWIAVQDTSESVRRHRGEVHAFAHAWRDALRNDGEYRGLSAEYWLEALSDAIDREREACVTLRNAHDAFMATIQSTTQPLVSCRKRGGKK